MLQTVYLNDTFVPFAEARVSASDAGFLFGAGVFETVLARAGRPGYFSRHIERLRTSCRKLGIDFSYSENAIRDIVEELLSRNDLSATEARVKILITPGDTSVHLSHRDGTLLISAIPYLRPSLHIPWKLLMTGTVQASSVAAHKTTSYLGYRMALHSAHADGYDDMILFDRHGHVSETSIASLLLFRNSVPDGELLLLPASPDALQGITRGVVADIVRERGIEVVEAPVSPHDLFEGVSVCVCNALLGPIAVGRINETEIPTLESRFLSSLRENWEEGAQEIT